MNIVNLENLEPIILITGDDYYLSKELVDSIIKLLPDGIKDIDCVIIGEEDKLGDVLFECDNLSFLSPRRVVYLSGRSKSLSSDEKKALDKYIKTPSDSSILVILDNYRVFKDYYKKVKLYELNRLSHTDVIRRAIELASINGIKMDRTAASMLSEYTDRSMSRVSIEIEKLCSYVMDKGVIDVEDIKECVHPESDYQIYQFISEVVKGDRGRGVEISESLLYSGTPPIVLLSSLINQYRKLLHLSLVSDKYSDKDIASMLKIPVFAVSKDKNVLNNYSQVVLKKITDKLYDLEYSFKSGKMTDEQALKTAIAIVLTKGGA